MIPTNDALTVVAAYFPQREFGTVRRDARRAYLDNLRSTVPGFGGPAAPNSQFGKLYGMADQRNFFRNAHGPGWALVGDAAHHKDSITARGISDGFLQAELLTQRVTPHLDDPPALRDALASYESARDDQLAESYYNTLSVAKLEIKDERLDLLRMMGSDPRLADQYFSVVSGVLSVEQVYSESLLSEAPS
jgi:flavin-dependent dehydrogenase